MIGSTVIHATWAISHGQRKVDEMRAGLEVFPHQRLKGRPELRLRVGDYRVLYEFGAKSRGAIA